MIAAAVPRSTLLTLKLATLAGLMPSIVIAYVLLWPGPDLVDRWGFYLGRDFVNFWAAGRLALDGRVAEIYDLQAYYAAIKVFFAPSERFVNFSYPPHALLLVWPLGLLPYVLALPLWVASGLAVFAACLRAGGKALMLWLMLAPATLLNATFGHAGLFFAALFVGGFLLLPRRPLLAGLLFGLLSVKPQLGLLLPPALLLMGERRAFAAAAATTVALVGLSILVFGLQPWHDYFANTVPFQRRVVTEMVGLYTAMMVTPYAAAWWLGIPAQWGLALQGAIAVVIGGGALAILRRPVDKALKVAVLALAATLVTPYCLNYDLALPTLALGLWLATRPDPLSPTARVAVCLFWFMPYCGMALALFGPPFLPLTVLALFAVLAFEACRPQTHAAPAPALA